MNQGTAFPAILHVRTAKIQISLRIGDVRSVFPKHSVGSHGPKGLPPDSKTMISRHGYAGRAESSLGAHTALQEMLRLAQMAYTPVSILRKSISGRHRPVRVADGPMTARCRFT